MIKLIAQGGPIMWPLIILSIISLAIIIERTIFILKLKLAFNQTHVSSLTKLLSNKELQQAINVINISQDPRLKIFAESNLNDEKTFRISFSHHAKKFIHELNRGIGTLDTAITLAPLLGLLGTVIGLINAFSSIGSDQITAPIAITGGISEALLATAYGLAIAIVCLVPFNYLNNLKDRITEELEDLGETLAELIKRKENQ